MSTKTVTRPMVGTSPFDGLNIVDGVIVQNKCTPIKDEATPAKKAVKKSTVKKTAEKKPEEKQEVKKETFEEVSENISKKEAELAAREEALKKAEIENAKKKALLDQGVQMLMVQQMKGNTMAEENKKETENKNTTTASSIDDAMSIIEKKRKENAEWLNSCTVKIETEDCWTQTKKGFCMGAGAAAGAGIVLGAIQFIVSLCGGDSN